MGCKVMRNAEMADLLAGYEAPRYVDLAVGAAAGRFDADRWESLTDELKNEVMYFVIGVARDAHLSGQMEGIDGMAQRIADLRKEASNG